MYNGGIMNENYFKMNKEKRKKIVKEFYETPHGKYVKSKLNFALVCGILCIIIGIGLIIYQKNTNSSIWDLIYGINVLAFGIIFLIMRYVIHIKKIKRYIAKK